MFQVNDNTILTPFHTGVMLRKAAADEPHYLAKSALHLPYNVYFMDVESRLVLGNDLLAINHNLVSIQDYVGKSVLKCIADREEAEVILKNDMRVMTQKTFQFYDESATVDDQLINYLTVKMPIFDENHHVIGLLGCSLPWVRSCKQVADFLTSLNKIGLISQEREASLSDSTHKQFSGTYPNKEIKQLTPMEISVAKLTASYYTAKQIAKRLKISPRTVEKHLANAKQKVKVSTKQDLIEIIFKS